MIWAAIRAPVVLELGRERVSRSTARCYTPGHAVPTPEVPIRRFPSDFRNTKRDSDQLPLLSDRTADKTQAARVSSTRNLAAASLSCLATSRNCVAVAASSSDWAESCSVDAETSSAEAEVCSLVADT